MLKLTKPAVVLCLLLAFFSCKSEAEEELCDEINHVLLVYMGGDNNLSKETYQKIEAIQKGWKGDCTQKLVIYHDASDATPALYEIVNQKGKYVLTTIEEYQEENSASADVFSRVIRKVRTDYPSSSYGLLLFSHASGWLPKGNLNSPGRSIIIDGNDEMELHDFVAAIPDHAFDYIVFEACFMAGVEVMYELKEKADYIVASSAEILSPGFAGVYPTVIGDLFKKPADLTSFTRTAFNYFDKQTEVAYRSATFSIIRTSELEALKNWVKQNCNFHKFINIKDYQYFNTNSHRLFFDFEDYYSSLLDTNEKKEELKKLINACVTYKAATPSFLIGYGGFEVKAHSGMTTYIPQDRYPYLNREFMKLKWAEVLQ